MGDFIKTQNSFSYGEISPEFYAVDNIDGLSELENMDVLESGGLRRRPGLKKLGSAYNGSIIVPFPITETEKYLVVISNLTMQIYSNDVKIATLIAPWHTDDLSKLQYAQRFNMLFFVHPDYSPRVLTKKDSGFNLDGFRFSENAIGEVDMPFVQFEDAKGVSITITNSDLDHNYAIFTTNVNFWTNDAVGERLYVNGKQWVVATVQSATVAIVYTSGDFSFPGTALYDWYEVAFSNKRGWPSCISFHQNRLIFGATKSAPNCIWMSKVGDYYNFNAGTGLDDEAIYVTLLSAQHHQICTIVSSDSLQILTSVGEWSISNSPLTPSNVSIKQQTSIGSMATKYLPPQQIESNTVFVSESGKDIRELNLDTLAEHYNANDLCTFAKHLMQNPISVSYNQSTHQLFVVMNDGVMAVLNRHTNRDISAWAKYTTDGYFKYVCVLDNQTYVIVKRGANCSLEKFDSNYTNDATDYNFSYKISAFPILINGHCPKKVRVRKISMRVIDTKTLFLNNHRADIPNSVYTDGNPGYAGDLYMNLLGTQSDTMKPLWTISSSEQLPATILSVTTDGWYLI